MLFSWKENDLSLKCRISHLLSKDSYHWSEAFLILRVFRYDSQNISPWRDEPYLASSSLYWASTPRLLLFSWLCLASSSSSSASCLCCKAVSLSWSRLNDSQRTADSSFSFCHTLDSASRVAQRTSTSLHRANTEAFWELREACSTYVRKMNREQANVT